MTDRRRLIWLGGGLVLLALVAVIVARTSSSVGGPSALSHRSSGLLVSQRYLEATGSDTELLDRSPTSELRDGVLVIAFPVRLPMTHPDLDNVAGFVGRGGTLVVGYSRAIRGYSERVLLDALGIDTERTDARLPVNPLRWWRQASRGWRPGPVDGTGRLRLSRPQRLPVAPAGATVWYADTDDRPAVFAVARGAGRLILVPAEALSNSGVSSPAGGELLARLQRSLGEPWIFDEYHHGLTTGEPPDRRSSVRALDFLGLQLLLGYGLGIVALSRRFGPAWRETRPLTGSTAAFLIDLGWLHDRLGHHAEAARALVERSVELDPRIEDPPSTDTIETGPELVELAQRLARTE